MDLAITRPRLLQDNLRRLREVRRCSGSIDGRWSECSAMGLPGPGQSALASSTAEQCSDYCDRQTLRQMPGREGRSHRHSKWSDDGSIELRRGSQPVLVLRGQWLQTVSCDCMSQWEVHGSAGGL